VQAAYERGSGLRLRGEERGVAVVHLARQLDVPLLQLSGRSDDGDQAIVKPSSLSEFIRGVLSPEATHHFH